MIRGIRGSRNLYADLCHCLTSHSLNLQGATSLAIFFGTFTFLSREKSAYCWSLLRKYITTHGPQNVKFIIVQQVKQIYQYKDVKENCIRLTQQYGVKKHAHKNS